MQQLLLIGSGPMFEAVKGSIIEMHDIGVQTTCDIVAQEVIEEHPELNREYRRIERLAEEMLHSEAVEESAGFQAVFDQFNTLYFGGRLPKYRVRVAYDLHRLAREPVFDWTVSSGLIRFEERTIYLRITREASMLDMLVHEMCHGATSGEHDGAWFLEMKRVYDLGAPVDDGNFRPDTYSDQEMAASVAALFGKTK